MKSNTVPSFQSSAYPLKALKLTAEDENTYIVSSRQSVLKVTSSVKVLPMVNPYPDQKQKESAEFGWYNHYE
jgi:hypothetical protein